MAKKSSSKSVSEEQKSEAANPSGKTKERMKGKIKKTKQKANRR